MSSWGPGLSVHLFASYSNQSSCGTPLNLQAFLVAFFFRTLIPIRCWSSEIGPETGAFVQKLPIAPGTLHSLSI